MTLHRYRASYQEWINAEAEYLKVRDAFHKAHDLRMEKYKQLNEASETLSEDEKKVVAKEQFSNADKIF